MTLKATWVDRNREPQCEPDPKFPNGTELDVSAGSLNTCAMTVPYPAPRCGLYIIECDRCGQRVGITTAGRPDDPRTVTLGCFLQKLDPPPEPGMTKIVLPDTRGAARTPHP